MEYVDLHSHSTASDGTLSPAEVVDAARRSGVCGLSLTDHDTIAGLARAGQAAAEVGLTFLPGIEISCTYPYPGIMHLLGYGIDAGAPALNALTSHLLEGRNDRNPRIVARLREAGVAITMEEVQAQAAGAVVGRPHIAAILVRKGYVSSVKHAFDKYLGPDGCAYFDKERLAPRRAIDLIRQSGGLPFLAHPVQLRTENDAQLQRIVKDLVDMGLRGIEVIHSDHDAAMVEKYSRLADRYGLLKSGGSDFHGKNKADILLGVANGRRIPREFLDRIMEQL